MNALHCEIFDSLSLKFFMELCIIGFEWNWFGIWLDIMQIALLLICIENDSSHRRDTWQNWECIAMVRVCYSKFLNEHIHKIYHWSLIYPILNQYLSASTSSQSSMQIVIVNNCYYLGYLAPESIVTTDAIFEISWKPAALCFTDKSFYCTPQY